MKNQKGISLVAVIGGIILIALVVVSVINYRDNQQKKAGESMIALMSKWDDALSVASASPRIALAAPVKDLQAIRAEAKDLKVTGCLLKPKEGMEFGMEETVQTFISFMRGSESDSGHNNFDRAALGFTQYRDSMNACGFYK